MSKTKLANTLKRLLPGQHNSRVRQAIMEAYQRATGAPSLNPEYYQSNITNIVENIITEVVGIVSPDGIIAYGSVTQDGNDLTLDIAWQWRMSGVAYKLIEETTIAIPPAATGYSRVDVIVGNMAGEVERIAGTEVSLPTVAVPPNIPANVIPLISVDVSDIGITSFQEWAMASFVRFDIADQNLDPAQRQNAKTNIQAVSRDTNDNKTGSLTYRDGSNNPTLILNQGDSVIQLYNAGDLRIKLRKGQTTGLGSSNPLFYLRGAGTATRALVTWVDSNGDLVFSILDSGVNQFKRASIQPRSHASNTSIRRDELCVYYSLTNTDDGQIDDLVLNDDTKLLILSNADDLSGIEMEEFRKLQIFNNTGSDLEIHAESASSIAANRFATGVVIPDQGFQEVIKIGTRIRLT